MRDAFPAFQPDRGFGGFQLAEDAGFQTQTPVAVANGGLVIGGSAVTGQVGPVRVYAGRGGLVIGGSARTTGPSTAAFSGSGVYTLPNRYRYVGQGGVVVGGGARGRVRARPPALQPRPRRYVVLGRGGLRMSARAVTGARDYVREVVLPDDEEVLALLMGGTRG